MLKNYFYNRGLCLLIVLVTYESVFGNEASSELRMATKMFKAGDFTRCAIVELLSGQPRSGLTNRIGVRRFEYVEEMSDALNLLQSRYLLERTGNESTNIIKLVPFYSNNEGYVLIFKKVKCELCERPTQYEFTYAVEILRLVIPNELGVASSFETTKIMKLHTYKVREGAFENIPSAEKMNLWMQSLDPSEQLLNRHGIDRAVAPRIKYYHYKDPADIQTVYTLGQILHLVEQGVQLDFSNYTSPIAGNLTSSVITKIIIDSDYSHLFPTPLNSNVRNIHGRATLFDFDNHRRSSSAEQKPGLTTLLSILRIMESKFNLDVKAFKNDSYTETYRNCLFVLTLKCFLQSRALINLKQKDFGSITMLKPKAQVKGEQILVQRLSFKKLS